MRKLIPWLLLIVVLLAVPASASRFPSGGPASTSNDDSCDISLLPAATLLLPYFEVDIANREGETTLFTITNVTNVPQIARVTLWTDWGYPVLDFNIWLTGYDTQSIDLFDIIARGIIAPQHGTGLDESPVGDLSNDDNPLLDTSNCDSLPGVIPAVYIERLQKTLRDGTAPAIGNLPACAPVGGVHQNAVGYATIDVVRECGIRLPSSPEYFEQEILWENVLTGDYQQIDSADNYAEGGPLVHIRAVPEGGANAAERAANPARYGINLERTFYARYQPEANRKLDGRQPLPSRFITHWIAGGPTGFETSLKIWREGRTTSSTNCSQYAALGKSIAVVELTLFDEEENPFTVAQPICCFGVVPELPSTSKTDITDSSVFPPRRDFVAGWMYLNLDNYEKNGVASQNWVVTTMRAQGRFSTDHDATALGNGCSPEVGQSSAYYEGGPIGPSP